MMHSLRFNPGIKSAPRTICELKFLYPNPVTSAWLKKAKSKMTFILNNRRKALQLNLMEAYFSPNGKAMFSMIQRGLRCLQGTTVLMAWLVLSFHISLKTGKKSNTKNENMTLKSSLRDFLFSPVSRQDHSKKSGATGLWREDNE